MIAIGIFLLAHGLGATYWWSVIIGILVNLLYASMYACVKTATKVKR